VKEKMAVLNFRADAENAMNVMAEGGITILPNDVGYSLIAAQRSALHRIFDTKKRAPSKLNAMLGNDALHRELHVVSARGRAIVEAITQDYDLPLGLIAPCRTDHPLLRALDPDTFERSTKGDTLLMLLNAGPFHREITRLSVERQMLLFGSSANLSMHGTKFRVEDMEPEITAIADVIVDYGLMKYHTWKASSTLLDCETLQVVRHGSCFENIADILRRHFAIELAPRPAA
jgi:tRNA A37 threonylcarbamoyladenosine synthetase subunit TsaC/SUA5/YrdC